MRGTRLADDVRTPLRVPGFVVVAAADRAVEVTRDEIERFASAYEAICGRSRRHSYTGDTFARVIEFGRDDETAPVGGSWTVTAGAAHGDEGQFARVSYEQSSRAVVVATDPFGMFPLFRASRGGLHYFSTSALALARHLAAAPHVLGLFVYLRTGYHFGTRTNWLDVERVDPGHRFVFTRDGVRVEHYWQPEPDE